MNKNKIVLAMLLACGSAHAASPRIVGGDEVSTAPSWMASLQARNSLTGVTSGHICGATLISPEWMMTAAHCVDGAGTAERTLLIGRSSSAVDEKSEVAIDQIIIHPGWGGIIDGTTSDLTDFQDDIALLHLAASQSADPVTRATSAPTGNTASSGRQVASRAATHACPTTTSQVDGASAAIQAAMTR